MCFTMVERPRQGGWVGAFQVGDLQGSERQAHMQSSEVGCCAPPPHLGLRFPGGGQEVLFFSSISVDLFFFMFIYLGEGERV